MPKQGLALGVALAMVACTSMRRVDPVQFIPQHKPGVVSVWTAPNHVTIVSGPRIVGDTLSGIVFEERWAVPLKDVVRVEAKGPNTAGTVLVVAGSALAVGGVYLEAKSGHGAGLAPCQPGLTCAPWEWH